MVPGRTRGVALFIRNPSGDILILRELETKPHLGKYAGMYSIPMETSRPGEPEPMALARMIAEELPGLEHVVQVNPQRVGWYRIVPRVWVSLYTASMDCTNLPAGHVVEVGEYAWLSATAALKLWLRQGAPEMISDISVGNHHVVRRHCAAPPLITVR